MLCRTMQQSFPVKKPPFFCLPALRPTWSLCSVTGERGEEYIVGQAAHNYLFEAGGAAVLGSIQPQPIDAAADGTLPLDKVAMKIKPDDSISPAPN
ncbi:low specificity L-threonine aldolase [Escherichia coli]|uniref:Low specificity L-threonine aldolase n=1 Tax=Escherichia coli TaxID=562 RepID=A0A376TJ99_ECOLX|nr:low specificity L-threonine aldolase [Escherichia coli]